MTVRIFNDIDGVYNAWNAHEVWPEESIREAKAFPKGFSKGLRIVWSSDLVDAINSLDVEFITASTWQDEASEHIWSMLGVEKGINAPYLSPPIRDMWSSWAMSAPSIEWKTEALVVSQTFTPTPFIWIDDELQNWPNGNYHKYLYIPEEILDRGLIIGPNQKYGITPDHIEEMKEFISKHS